MPTHDHLAAENRLLHELAIEEAALIKAEEALDLARSDYEVAARKYAAVRDLVTNTLGFSPYHEDAEWSPAATQIVPSDRRGAYRFLLLKPRDAIAEALAEVSSELTLEQLDERLKSGGLDLGLRAINAALMRLNGVEKTAKGGYRLVGAGRKRRAA